MNKKHTAVAVAFVSLGLFMFWVARSTMVQANQAYAQRTATTRFERFVLTARIGKQLEATQIEIRPSPTHTTTPIPSSTPTLTPSYHIPRPTPSCLDWTQITSGEEGKDLCVKGKIKHINASRKRVSFLFSTKDGAFRFVLPVEAKEPGTAVPQEWFYHYMVGLCVEGKGTLKVFDEIPYIEIGPADLRPYACPGEEVNG